MRLKSIDLLRGLASLTVAFCHLSSANLTGVSKSIDAIGYYGYLGVDVFFVISGFVLPYSLYQKEYTIRNFPRFLLKRLIRLEPGYFAAIAVGIAIPFFFFRTLPTLDRFLLHFGYLNDIYERTWILGIFWTLAIEFQFYIFFGLAYSWFVTKSNFVFSTFIGILLSSALLLAHIHILPKFFGLFLIGILVFRFIIMNMNKALFFVLIMATIACIIKINGLAEAMAAVLTGLGIMFLRINEQNYITKIFLWLGTISYSLYLTHWPFGIPVVKQLRKVPIIQNSDILRVGGGLAVALITAWCFYVLIERPSMKWSSRIKLKKTNIEKEDLQVESRQPAVRKLSNIFSTSKVN